MLYSVFVPASFVLHCLNHLAPFDFLLFSFGFLVPLCVGTASFVLLIVAISFAGSCTSSICTELITLYLHFLFFLQKLILVRFAGKEMLHFRHHTGRWVLPQIVSIPDCEMMMNIMAMMTKMVTMTDVLILLLFLSTDHTKLVPPLKLTPLNPLQKCYYNAMAPSCAKYYKVQFFLKSELKTDLSTHVWKT